MAPDLRPTIPVPPPPATTPEKSLANRLRLLAWDLERGVITVAEAQLKMVTGVLSDE